MSGWKTSASTTTVTNNKVIFITSYSTHTLDKTIFFEEREP